MESAGFGSVEYARKDIMADVIHRQAVVPLFNFFFHAVRNFGWHLTESRFLPPPPAFDFCLSRLCGRVEGGGRLRPFGLSTQRPRPPVGRSHDSIHLNPQLDSATISLWLALHQRWRTCQSNISQLFFISPAFHLQGASAFSSGPCLMDPRQKSWVKFVASTQHAG